MCVVSLANHVCGWWPMVIAGKMVASSLPLTKSENENVFAVMLSVVLCIKYVCVCLCRLLQLFHNKTLQKLFHRYNRPRREKTQQHLGNFWHV